jgi:hypothetical protein
MLPHSKDSDTLTWLLLTNTKNSKQSARSAKMI